MINSRLEHPHMRRIHSQHRHDCVMSWTEDGDIATASIAVESPLHFTQLAELIALIVCK